jgi:cellulose biosynthesis protein BcsQ
MKRKSITFFNKKGGVGKTSLAFNIAKDLDMPLLSNDDSVIESIYPNKAKVLDRIQAIDADCIYDLGGFVEDGVVELFKKSTTIVIPTLLDVNSIKRTINTVLEINNFCDDIIIIVNRVQKSKLSKYQNTLDILKGLGKELYYIRESEAVVNSIHLGKTITELYNESGLSKHSYRPIYEEYTKILERIKNGK